MSFIGQNGIRRNRVTYNLEGVGVRGCLDHAVQRDREVRYIPTGPEQEPELAGINK